MRTPLDQDRLLRLLRELGSRARGPGRIYLTGGTSAVLVGWRASTLDADLKLDPEPEGVFEAIRATKDLLDTSIELASPDGFVPALPGWRDRSPWIMRSGHVDFFHYDFYTQALAKLSRGFERDEGDVREMVKHGLVDPARLAALFLQVEDQLVRYPSVDEDRLRVKVAALASEIP